MAQDGTSKMHLDITYPPTPEPEWDFMDRTFDGIIDGKILTVPVISLILYNGDQNIYYGGHLSEHGSPFYRF